MAEIPYGGHAPAAGAQMRGTVQGTGKVETLGTLANWSGAAVSLALILGIGVWGYKMLSRDVTGVPIVRAASGESMRVQPVDPGGRPAMHQGLAVNQVAAEGGAEKPAERLVLAPTPVTLDDGDSAGSASRMTATAEAAEVPPNAAPVVSAAAEPNTPQMASIRALADQLTSGSARLGGVEPAPDVAPETMQPVSAPAKPPAKPAKGLPVETAAPAKKVVKGGIKSSLRPIPRPNGLRKVAAVVPAATALEVDPAGIPAGTKLAQLGAFDSPEVARKEWDRLSQKFGDYLVGKQRVIQKAQSGGRMFYRLRAMGFADLSDARRFCSALVAERADCIPVATK